MDLFTILEEFNGEIEGLKVALVGDLKFGRAVRSLAYLLGRFPVRHIYFVSGTGMEIHQGILNYLGEHGIPFSLECDLMPIAREIDVLYMTRLQRERIGETDMKNCVDSFGTTTLTREVASRLKEKAIVLHPLPRNNEIPADFDSDRRAKYFSQVRRGVAVRAALLKMILL